MFRSSSADIAAPRRRAGTIPRPGPGRAVARRSPGAGEPFPLGRRDRSSLPLAREMSAATARALVALAALGALILRLVHPHGLSLDELRAVDAARRPFGRLIDSLISGGIHPPLHPVLDWCLIRLFGDGSLAVRLPSLLAGVALVPAAAWLAGELFDRRTAVLSAVLVAVAPVLVWYGQEASGYELTALFGTLAVLGAVRASRRGRPVDWALHATAAALAVWADWSGLLIVLATEVVLAAELGSRSRAGQPVRRLAIGWAIDTAALLCQLVPLGLLLASQLHTGGGLAGITGVSASGVSFYSAVSNVSYGLFGFQPSPVVAVLSAVWPLAMLACLLLVGRGGDRRGGILIWCALVPVVGVVVLGLTAPASFDVRYALGAVPLVAILLARVATGWPRGATGRALVAAGLVAISVGALADEQLAAGNPRRYDYAPAFALVQRAASPHAAVFLLPGNLRPAARRYAPALHTAPLSTRLPSRRRAPEVFVVSSFSHQPRLQALLNRELGALRATRRPAGHRALPGISVWWFR